MKNLLLAFLFLSSASIIAQVPIDYETTGNNWVWNIFAQGTNGSFDVVANPAPGGLNTSDSCAMLVVDTNGDPWAGVWCSDFPDLTIDANNCIVKILVYKDVISDFNCKLEAPNIDHNVPNTVINQWEELSFDYSAHIGTTAATLTIIPDFSPAPRTYGSTSYWDYVRFTPQVVPVELTSFTAAYVGASAKLDWATATELNNRGFEIQKSVNGASFATVGFVDGHGTTTEQQQYSFVDKNVDTRVNNSYRLKQLDFNGSFEYSKVVNLGITLPSQFLLEQNYPNPFNPSTKISFAVPVKSNVTLEVYNLIGQRITTLFAGSVDAGTHTELFNANGISSGIYLVKMIAVGENGSQFSSSKKMTLLK